MDPSGSPVCLFDSVERLLAFLSVCRAHRSDLPPDPVALVVHAREEIGESIAGLAVDGNNAPGMNGLDQPLEVGDGGVATRMVDVQRYGVFVEGCALQLTRRISRGT